MGHRRAIQSKRLRLRLMLESLESRRVMAGYQVFVFVDQNNSRSFDSGDTPAVNRLVYADLNNNNSQDSTDPIAVTNQQGLASFAGLSVEGYQVALVDGSRSQVQSSPTTIDGLTDTLAVDANLVLANQDLSRVWAFNANGDGRRVTSDGSVLGQASLGQISASVVDDNSLAWVIVNGPQGQQLTTLDLASGTTQTFPIAGLNGRSISRLVVAGNKVIAQLESDVGTELALATRSDSELTISNTTLDVSNLTAIAGYSGAIVIAQTDELGSKVTVVDSATLTPSHTTQVDGHVNSLVFTHQAASMVAATSSGAVVLSNSFGLPVQAILSEAIGPLASSTDGRVITGSVANNRTFIVWDANSWQPLGRTELALSLGTAPQLLGSSSGDNLLIHSESGLGFANLAVQVGARFGNVADEQATLGDELVQIGVRVDDDANAAPQVASSRLVELVEDDTTNGNLNNLVTDPDGDSLYYAITTATSHGQLELSPDGRWNYQPDPNFFGNDRAVFRVYDGQTSQTLAVDFNVLPVNDAPQGIRSEVTPLPENATSTLIGFVTIDDADPGQSYRIESSDARFQVRDGIVFLAQDARLDFESEPTIELVLTATENSAEAFQITNTITLLIQDVNESPQSIRLISTGVRENQAGAIIGRISILDPDKVPEEYQYLVSDSRFEVVHGNLKLHDGVDLNYESVDSLDVTVTVINGSHELSETLSVKVLNANDPGTEILLDESTVFTSSPGAVVGPISVVDEDSEAYSYAVSDTRFTVVDGQLRLNDDQQIADSEAPIMLAIIAQSPSGDFLTKIVTIKPTPAPSPFQNPQDPRDVNGDGAVTPLDALIIINDINSNGAHLLPKNGPGEGDGGIWIDVNGDGMVSPLDVLLIINHLNNQALAQSQSEGEGFDSQFAFACPPFHEQDPNSEESELETLLEQLAHSRDGMVKRDS